MGNRAVIAFRETKTAPCIYVHWNGGRASVEAFLAAARDLGIRHIDNPAEFFPRLKSVILSFLGGSVYLETYGSADRDNWDNGVFLIDADLNIRGRRFARGSEEINPEKTASIRADIVARHANFND